VLSHSSVNVYINDLPSQCRMLSLNGKALCGRNEPQGILGLPPATNTLLRNAYAFWGLEPIQKAELGCNFIFEFNLRGRRSESAERPADRSDHDHGFAGVSAVFIVAAQSAPAVQLTEGAFDDPAVKASSAILAEETPGNAAGNSLDSGPWEYVRMRFH
jgi:hypothetical protein